MSVTLDNLAHELMCWFAKESDQSRKYWCNEVELTTDFAEHLNRNSNFKALHNYAISNRNEGTHLLICNDDSKANEGVIAKFIIDGNKNYDELHDVVLDTTNQLCASNLDDNFHGTTKCIVSVYNDLNNRRKFHEIEFIEIYQQYGMGCAIKRVR